MTVFHLISGGETGGSKNHLLSLLTQFPEGEVVLGVMQEGQLSNEAIELGIRTVVFKQSSRYDFSILNKMKTFLREENIQLVHTHGPRANFFTYILRQMMNFKWITTIHSDPSKDFVKGGVKGKIFTTLNMKILHKIDHFFAVSHRFRDMLVGFGIEKNEITVIYNGISFDEPNVPNLQRADFGLNETDFVITMIARLHPIKNHPVAFQAIKKLIDKDIPVKLLCVGDGPERENIETLLRQMKLEDNVQLLGFRGDVHAILQLSDVCLLTSDSESFPLVLLEAARAHTPVVTTDVGGVAKLISEDLFGRVVPIGNSEAVFKALQELFMKKDSNELEGMGDALYSHAKTSFSLGQLYKVTIDTYHQM